MATPSLAMIPSAYADSKVYSVLPNNGDGDFSFNRDSSATRIGQNGLIQTVGFFGNELITNGSFATDSDWTKGTGWTISGGKASQSGGVGQLSQTIGLATGVACRIEITLTITAGTIRIAPGTTGVHADFSVSGTHSFNSSFGGNSILYILGTSSSFVGSISNVSIKEIQGDQPRLNYDISNGVVQSCPSLLLEPASTNLVTTSETLSNYWGLQGATLIVDNQAVNPTGSLYANKLNTPVTGSFNSITNVETTTYDGKTLNVSVFAKKITNDYIFFYNIGSSSGSNGVWFNISNGTIGNNGGAWSNSKIEDYGNGWYRCSATVTFGTNTNYLYIANTDGNGNNTSTIGSQTYLWGSQIEEQSYATSYIPTNGSSQTRAAETCNGAGNAATFNSTEGVLYAEISALANDLTNRYIALDSSNSSNYILLRYDGVSNNIAVNYKASGLTGVTLTHTVPDITLLKKVAFKYKDSDFALWIDGVEVDTSGATGRIANPNTFNNATFSVSWNANAHFYGKVKDLRVYNEALTDAQLQTLTTL